MSDFILKKTVCPVCTTEFKQWTGIRALGRDIPNPGNHDDRCHSCKVRNSVQQRLAQDRTTRIAVLESKEEFQSKRSRFPSYKAYSQWYLEQNGTEPEQRLFRRLCAGCPHIRFIHQFEVPHIMTPDFIITPDVPFGKQYRLDIYGPDSWLAIEVDGWSHIDPSEDEERDRLLLTVGIRTLRFTTEQVCQSITKVVDTIDTVLRTRADDGIRFDECPAKQRQ
jgi:very-short-patch-repair endonuclease